MISHDQQTPGTRIAIIGGGITGLAAAHRLCELAPTCQTTVFEASSRLGGILHTERQDDFLLEFGADNFITNVPWGVDLCRRIGFVDRLLETATSRRRALVVRAGKLHPVPEGFMLMEPRELWPVLRSPLLSLRGKARLLAEFFIRPRQAVGDESLASFARRRLGREVFERLVQPLAAGIYTADPEKLSLAATMPRFLEMERRHGGLIRAVRKSKSGDGNSAGGAGSGARYSLFVSPREGMQSLATAVAARLPAETIKLNCAVTKLAARPAGGWDVWTSGATEPTAFDAAILATSAPLAARLVEPFDSRLGSALAAIPYASSAVVVAAYKDSQLGRPLDGFGFVVPEIERRPILAASFSSMKFVNRAPQGWQLVRVFLGGSARPELAAASDDELRRIAGEQLSELIGAQGAPAFARVGRWPSAMPQYHLGHLERVAEIGALVKPWAGLELAGNAYEGVGVPACIRSGEAAAERILASKPA
jgi:protoporphyrinogen/coproporphyrinogen III oxidase